MHPAASVTGRSHTHRRTACSVKGAGPCAQRTQPGAPALHTPCLCSHGPGPSVSLTFSSAAWSVFKPGTEHAAACWNRGQSRASRSEDWIVSVPAPGLWLRGRHPAGSPAVMGGRLRCQDPKGRALAPCRLRLTRLPAAPPSEQAERKASRDFGRRWQHLRIPLSIWKMRSVCVCVTHIHVHIQAHTKTDIYDRVGYSCHAKHHRPGGINNRNVFCPSSGGRTCKIKVPTGLVPSEVSGRICFPPVP